MQRELSSVEKRRIARAFFRFETFRHLVPPQHRNDHSKYNVPTAGFDFLKSFDLDEVEEIACVRDYLIRKLWHNFDLLENDFAQGRQSQRFIEEL